MVQAFAPVAGSEPAEMAARIFAERIKERNVEIIPEGYRVIFEIDSGLVREEFALISSKEDTKILSGGTLGLIHGAGYFLRHTEFTDVGVKPCERGGSHKPKSPIRGTYFATHFFNFYHVAPYNEMKRYIEDLALWGFNNIAALFPHIDMKGEDDPECDKAVERLNVIFTKVHELGMKATLLVCNNTTYQDFPESYRAVPIDDPTRRRGNHGNVLCTSIPEANQMIMDDLASIMRKLQPSNFDIIMTWPYDEGGCGCEKCRPWGRNGYLRTSKQIFELGRKHFPNAQRCLSTWLFDTPNDGEWPALADSLKDDKWCDIILADSHESFPAYPLEHGVPGDLKLINFPEVSMWGLQPWGGWGANPLPERFTKLWAQASHILSGGLIYSEGIFEDINKVVISQCYWQGEADWRETLEQYARYEIGLTDASEFIELVTLIERTHTDVAETGRCNPTDADKAFAIAKEIDAKLPKWAKTCWRWRIVYLRALLDARRFRIAEGLNQEGPWSKLNWKLLLRDEAEIQDAFREIIKWFHCSEKDRGDKYHVRVRPLCD